MLGAGNICLSLIVAIACLPAIQARSGTWQSAATPYQYNAVNYSAMNLTKVEELELRIAQLENAVRVCCTLLQLIAPRRRPRRARAHRAARRAPRAAVQRVPHSHGGRHVVAALEWCTGLLHAVCGFGMLEVGSVTARSSQNILLKNLLDASLGAIMWWLVGHPIAYDGPNGFFGLVPEARGTMAVQYRAQRDDATDADFAAGGGYDWAFWWFQFTFAAASCTIVSGAVAERAQLLAYLLYSGWITMLIYPVVVHWVWCEAGWLSVGNPDAFLNGVIDFAGSGVVHAVGGTAALVGAFIIGRGAGASP